MATAEIKTSLGVISISEQVLAIIARDTALQINEVMSCLLYTSDAADEL